MHGLNSRAWPDIDRFKIFILKPELRPGRLLSVQSPIWTVRLPKEDWQSQISSEKKLEENQQYDSINQSEATIFIKKISPNVLCQDSYSGRNLWVRIRTDPSELFPQSSKSFSIESWIVANVLKLQTLKRSDWEVGPNLTVNSDLFSLYSTRPGDFFPILIGFFTSLGLFASVTFPLLFSVKSFHCHLH